MTWDRDRFDVELHELRAAAAAYRSFLHRPAKSERGALSRAEHLACCKCRVERAAGAVASRRKIIDGQQKSRNLLCVCGHYRTSHWNSMSDPTRARRDQIVADAFGLPAPPMANLCHSTVGQVISAAGTTPAHWCPCREFKMATQTRKPKLKLLRGIES